MSAASSRALDDGVARLPPMGWNSWNAFAKDIDEQLFMDMADAMIESGLADAGYVYVNVDGGWCGPDANEALADRFPSGMKSLADYLHARGLKLGLYTHWRSIGEENRDARQWAEWGVDFIKNDAWKTPSGDAYWGRMRDAIDAMGRPMVHSIHFSDEESNPDNICELAHMWRITNDIQDYYDAASIPDEKKSWAFSTLDIIDRMAEVSPLIRPGCWADPDMMEIGNGNQTLDEYKTQFTMWCLLPAPLIMGHDLRSMSDDIRDLLSNREAIAVNQDPAVIPARRIRTSDASEVWSRRLADGSLCVVLLQKTGAPREVAFTWDELGLDGSQRATIRDLWKHESVGSFTDRFSMMIPAHGCTMLRLTHE